MKQPVSEDDLKTGDVERGNDPKNRKICTDCNGKKKIIVDMGGPDCEVPCRRCNTTGWELSQGR